MESDSNKCVTTTENNQIVISWSYSYFLYLLQRPFEHELNDINFILSSCYDVISKLLKQLNKQCDLLEKEMYEKQIVFRPNKIYIHCLDIDYDFPDDYNFIDTVRNFINTSGIICFNYLDNFKIVKQFLEWFQQPLCKVYHPLTGDTIWHLNPFLIDLMRVEIANIYNFRGESPNERRQMAEIFNFPAITKFQLDITNNWTMETEIYVDGKCFEYNDKDSKTLSKYITKQQK